MSATHGIERPTGDRLGSLARPFADALQTIARLRWRHWRAALLIIAIFTAENLMQRFGEATPSITAAEVARIAASDLLDCSSAVLLGLLAWAIAIRPSQPLPASQRPRRLATALVIATLLHAVIVPSLLAELFGPIAPCMHDCGAADWSKVPAWLQHVGVSGEMLIIGGLLLATLEMKSRNRELLERVAHARRERDRMARAELDARLTAMQAQVDPQFLFDTLVDVETAYGRQREAGADLLDRLIAFLRTALPLMRSDGSTVAVEVGLVKAWLEVVAARRDGRPTAVFSIGADCADACCSPMVLLPLVQWAVGDPAGGPVASSIELRIERHEGDGASRLIARLRALDGPKVGDANLEPIRERLIARYGEKATLARRAADATEEGAGNEVVTLLGWPDEKASDRSRC